MGKYNDENTVDWLTSNKIHSYVQRLDEVRKYAFGTMNVIDRKATKGYYEVCGAWICRGTDGPKHILAAHEESETFEWETHDFEKISEEKSSTSLIFGVVRRWQMVPRSTTLLFS